MAGAGWLVGCFTPAIGRKVKSWFSKEGAVVKADASKAVASAEKKL
jgi:hypothetical protein